MNIFLCAQKSFGRAVLKELIKRGHTLAGVAPPPQDKYYDKVTGYAIKCNIPIIKDCDRLLSSDIPDGVDLIVAAHSHWFISSKILSRAKWGGIGFHPSLLPLHRGRDAVRWAIEMRERVTGATVYWLDNKVDGGDICLQETVLIHRSWDSHTLWKTIFPIGVKLICNAVDMIERGNIIRVPQDEEFATWEPSFDVPRLKRNELLGLPMFNADKRHNARC